MLIRTGLWSLEAAQSWLRSYDWGKAIACTIEDNPEPQRRVAWICMVMDMEAMMSGSNRIPPAVTITDYDGVTAAEHHQASVPAVQRG